MNRLCTHVGWLVLLGLLLALGPHQAAATDEQDNSLMHFYIGTYTRGESEGIYRSAIDVEAGSLVPPTLAGEARNPSFLAVHPAMPVLYAAVEAGGSGGVAAFSIDPDSRDLSPLNQQPAGGAGTCHVSVEPNGDVVLAANYSAGSVAAFAVNADGTLIPAAFIHEHAGSGPNEARQKGPHAHCFIPSPNGQFALSCNLGTDEIYVYPLKPSAELQVNEPPMFRVAPGSGPRHLAFSEDGRFVYVINELSNTITAFAWDSEKGTAEEVQTIATLPEGFTGENTTAEITVHPNGRFVYGSNRGHDTIAIFERNAEDGRLTPRGHVSTGGRTPRHFALSPDGRFLIAANQQSGNLVLFAVDPETGGLKATGSTIEVDSPVCVRFVP